MDKKSMKRKIVFSKASQDAFDELEKNMPSIGGGKDDGNWIATKLAVGIIGLNILDVIDAYEDIRASSLSDDAKESALLACIHKVSLLTAVDIFRKTLLLIGTSGRELEDALREIEADIQHDIEEAQRERPGWDDIPEAILKLIAEETGVSVDELCERYAFRAIDVDSGEEIGKEQLRDMTTDNTVFETVKEHRCKSSDDEYRVDDQEGALDEFLRNM